MLKKVEDTLRKYKMVEPGDTVIAAVSGGADSMAMLHALYALREKFALKLHVCHLNHNLRGAESKRDLEFVRETARSLGLEFKGRTLRAGTIPRGRAKSLQAEARARRLKFLDECMKKFKARKIAMGHTMDDQAETVLMRLIKGSGPGGLAGMRPKGARIIRPLFDLTREDVLRFLEDSNLDYVIDSSNLKADYLRNDLRLNLIPFLRERYNPNIVTGLCRTSRALARDDDFIGGIAEFLGVIVKRTAGVVSMDRVRLKDLHSALLTRVFLNAAGFLKKRGEVYAPHIDSFMKIVHGGRPNARAVLPGGLMVVRSYDIVELTLNGAEEPVKPFRKAIKVPGETRLKELKLAITATLLPARPRSLKDGKAGKAAELAAFFDYSALSGPLSVRTIERGDRLQPMGLGGRKKIKNIFIDQKVPLVKRKRTPLICCGEDILWAVGLKQSELCKVTQSTVKVLKIECKWLKG